MSDFNKQKHGESGTANPWQNDPFAAYDDPTLDPSGTGASLDAAGLDGAGYPNAADYSAWRRPDFAQAPAYDAPTADFTDAPAYQGGYAPFEGYPQGNAPAFDAAPYGAQQPPYQNNMGYAAPVSFAAPQANQGFAAPQDESSFAAMGADAPTRIARPMVSKHTTVARNVRKPSEDDQAAPETPTAESAAASADEAPRRRRAGRMARRAVEAPMEQAETPVVEPSVDAPSVAPEASEPSAFDPFSAGDSEAPRADEQPRRAAVPGGRYTGARTAMPQSGAPMRRAQIEEHLNEQLEGGEAPSVAEHAQAAKERVVNAREGANARPVQRPRVDANGKPLPPQRPRVDANGNPLPPQRARVDANGNPLPPQHPRVDANGNPLLPQRPRVDANGRPIPQNSAYQRRQALQEPEYRAESRAFDPRRAAEDKNRRASVERPNYDFENAEEEDEEQPRRKGGALIAVVVVLLIIGALLAGVLLPDWGSMGGGFGTAMNKIQSSVKSLVGIQEESIKTFYVSPTDATAPIELVFNIEASTGISAVRVIDQNGMELAKLAQGDSDTAVGSVTSNSNANIWTLRYTMNGAYSGVFTAQAMKKDGTWDEGVTLQQAVSVAEPVVVIPPMQSFAVDVSMTEVPATLTFTIVSSTDVTAVQIIDDYGSALATAYYGDAGVNVTDDGTVRTWSIAAHVTEPYAGAYYAAYETDADLTFNRSEYSVGVTVSAAVEATDTPAPTATASPAPATQPTAEAAVSTDEPAADAFAETATDEPAADEMAEAATDEPTSTDSLTAEPNGASLAPAVSAYSVSAETDEDGIVTGNFSIVTSTDVQSVEVLDDNDETIVIADVGEDGTADNGSERTWELSTMLDETYSGGMRLLYMREADGDFVESDYTATIAYADGVAEITNPTIEATTQDMPAEADGTPDAGADTSADPAADDTAADSGDTATEPTATTQAQAEMAALPTAVPILTASADASADPTALSLSGTVYEGTTKQTSYSRNSKIVINDPFNYAAWDKGGVLTFRSGPFRQNAAFGTAKISEKTLSELWKVQMEGSLKAKSGTLYGVGWPGQPAIVIWPTEIRQMLGISDDAKTKTALKEVIVPAQNGKIYFLDLTTGENTRDPLETAYPSNGVVSVATDGAPMIAVGQSISILSGKTLDNGLHFINLITNKEMGMLSTKEKLAQSTYTGVSGAPLFDKNTGAMVVGSENGVLYTTEPTAALTERFDHVLGNLKYDFTTQRYRTLVSKQDKKQTNINNAVAMYSSYIYYGDKAGVVQCVDVNTLSTVWAINTGDAVNATIALDMDDESTVALYTGNTVLNQGKSGVCTIRRVNALTGKIDWEYAVPAENATYNKAFDIGCLASPVVGQGSVSDLVFFTVSNGESGATIFALSKSSGSVKWQLALESEAVSSPVAVYNDDGSAWIIQGEKSGKLNMIDAASGDVVNTLQLEGSIEASPAVYKDVLVIATTGKGTSYIYGIQLK